MEIDMHLTPGDIAALLEALDAYEYWELGDSMPRNNGCVFIPGDLDPEADRYWGDEPAPSAEQQEAVERITRCRELAHRLLRKRDETADAQG